MTRRQRGRTREARGKQGGSGGVIMYRMSTVHLAVRYTRIKAHVECGVNPILKRQQS